MSRPASSWGRPKLRSPSGRFSPGLTQSELFTIMTSGMAHVSGAVMAAYVKIAHVEITHLLTAVIMTAPGDHHARQDLDPGDGEAGDRGQR